MNTYIHGTYLDVLALKLIQIRDMTQMKQGGKRRKYRYYYNILGTLLYEYTRTRVYFH